MLTTITRIVPLARLTMIVALLVMAFAALPVPAAHAASTICVVGGACHPSLQAAINAANTGDTIEIGAGVNTEAGITITKNLTIRGQSASQSIVQAAETPRTADNRVFVVNSGVTATLKDLTVRHGYINDGGGGILNRGSLTLRRVTVSQNGTWDGRDAGSCSSDHCFTGDGDDGGGIYNSGTLTVLYSTISDNFTGRGGNLVRTVACVDDSGCDTRGRNAGNGGGVKNDTNRTLVMSNSTLSGNSTGAAGTCSGPDCSGSGFEASGGGLYAVLQFAYLNNVTITNNRSNDGGGINHDGRASASTVSIKNSLVVGNFNLSGQPSDCVTSGGIGIVSEGYNLVGAGTGCPAGGTGDLTTSNVGSVLNTTLANNGGPTLTHALVAGSAAINAGNPAAAGSGGSTCLQADQRTFVRPDRCDIGAFELGGTPDTTPPDTSITANPPNLTNSSDASFSFTGSDSGSGLEGFDCNLDNTGWMECASPKAYSALADGSHTFQVRAIDNSNNKDASSASYTWVIETIAPSVTVNQSAGQADPTIASPIHFRAIFSEDVTGFAGSDVVLSGAAGATTATVTGGPSSYDIAVSGMTTSGSVIASIAVGVATDAAGNSNTASSSADNTVTFIFDTTPPVISPTIVGTLGTNGWYTNDVSVSWAVVDQESAVANQTGCEAQSISSDTSGVTFTCTATSAGGTASQSVTIKRDASAPSISAAATSAPNAAGWYMAPVTVRFTCADALAGIPSGACPADQTLSAEGAAVSSTAQTISDAAGNTSAPSNLVTVKIDRSAPTLNPIISPSPIRVGQSASANPNATDALSGIASQSCGAIDTSSIGPKTVSCIATDIAGNTGSASVNYTVLPAFPTTGVLDSFNRANGKVGSNWEGLTGTDFYKIAANKLDVQLGGPLVWKPTSFGTSQEAFITLSTIDSKNPSQGVLLKVQTSSIPNAGAISVVYDAKAKAVRVSALRLGQNGAWTLYPNQAATFANGDVLGARAKADGSVQIYKNGTQIATVTLNAADKAFFNAKGGKIGIWTVAASNAIFDDFGGGTVAP